jgi:hypothetical protein
VLKLCNDKLVLKLSKLLIKNIINEKYTSFILAKYAVSQTNLHRNILGIFPT